MNSNRLEAFSDGVIPRSVVTSSPHFHRVVAGITPPNGVRVHVSGIDLVRDGSGTFREVGDCRSQGGRWLGVETELGAGRPQPCDVGPEHLGDATGDTQCSGGAPEQGRRPEPIQCRGDRRWRCAGEQLIEGGRVDPVRDDGCRLEHLQGGQVEPVDGTGGARAGGAAGRQGGQVAGRRSRQVRAGDEEGGEVVVGAGPQVVGE